VPIAPPGFASKVPERMSVGIELRVSARCEAGALGTFHWRQSSVEKANCGACLSTEVGKLGKASRPRRRMRRGARGPRLRCRARRS
jgi:hypothetical protein